MIEPTADLLRTIPAGEAVELPPAEGWVQWDLAERLRDGLRPEPCSCGQVHRWDCPTFLRWWWSTGGRP